MFEVVRPNNTVIVDIFKDKVTGKYRYVNLTYRHICPCQFDTVEDAIADMDQLIKEGKVIKYTEI